MNHLKLADLSRKKLNKNSDLSRCKHWVLWFTDFHHDYSMIDSSGKVRYIYVLDISALNFILSGSLKSTMSLVLTVHSHIHFLSCCVLFFIR